MMVNEKAVLISVNKPHTDNIFSFVKGLEWRKKPLPKGLYYVYETKNKGGCGKVVGEMQIVGSKAVNTNGPLEVCLVNAGCVHPVTLKKYANNGIVYANFIQNAKRYDEPKKLTDFIVPSKIGCCNEGKCRGCTFLERGNAAAGIENDCVASFDTDEYKPLRRPPQSWCYVEELKDGHCCSETESWLS